MALSTGERADYEMSVSQYYNSLDGTRYRVTDENRNKIYEIMKNDIAHYSKEEEISILRMPTPVDGISTMGAGDFYDDSSLYFSAFIEKIGVKTSVYKYIAFLDFSWKSWPQFTEKDSIALAWDDKFTGMKNTLSKYYNLGDQSFKDISSNMTASNEMHGIKARFLLFPSKTLGGISTELAVSERHLGDYGSFQAAYVHSLIPFTGGVSIGPASIDVPTSWLSQEFRLDFNLKIGY
ncbi:hypothetical protein SAMN05192533_11780 [Mesobacillus persicus]|uniref:Uncharacterized protein n=1 Tax=Mesobacillus persicus TaxID=930146 RepID=A0A1H8ILU9_9BACI|nr:hypothetical protein SAMN05192533_11780 [Mesobacillus persicus]